MTGLDWSKKGLHIKRRLLKSSEIDYKSNLVKRTTRQEVEKTLNPLGRRSQKISWLRLVLHSTGPTEMGIFGGVKPKTFDGCIHSSRGAGEDEALDESAVCLLVFVVR
ncbi:hypothetical protein EVAR_52804_1 [Eumeta japonica]|uniref:Uncharacterized protein n=1 Tax=Eumeta variegata TaxID=151549 RepID=A0A4C1Y533_EUMVA|nr:hypothetical protein EVAR_52804_1 [Eumeta japonica]